VNTSRPVLATIAVLALTLPAAAQDDADQQKGYRIFGQLTSEVELNWPDECPAYHPGCGDYTKVKQLISFNVEWSKITVGAQLELLVFSDASLVDPLDLDRTHDFLELRRYYVDYQSDRFSGRLGTFFSSFGRGLSLYVQKNEALGFDEPIHGGVARLTLEHVDVTVLGGRVSEPVLQNQYDREFEDELYGGRVLVRLPFDLYLGGSVVSATLDRFFPEGTDETDVWSVEAGGTGLWGVLDLSGEWSEIEKTENDRAKEGYGRYFSATAYVGPVSILAEYKDYYNFSYRYNEPPNAGRADEKYEHDDVKGPRLLVSADIFSIGSIVHASYADFNTHKTPTSPGGEGGNRSVEWYAGIEQLLGPVYFTGSYFDRDWSDLDKEESHTIADFHLTVGGGGEIIVGYDQRLENTEYYRLETTRSTLAYSQSPWGTVSLRYSFEDISREGKKDFWGLEVQYLPKPNLILTFFGGGDPGGLVCAGGQCRIEPRFEGYRANVTWRF